ncbi:MAG: Cell division protein FtsL [Burkholderia gladioli]|nr:MAG: Cell division protein FtsL [Burkholderia gladioli]
MNRLNMALLKFEWVKRASGVRKPTSQNGIFPPLAPPQGGEVLAAGRARGPGGARLFLARALKRARRFLRIKGSLRRASPALDPEKSTHSKFKRGEKSTHSKCKRGLNIFLLIVVMGCALSVVNSTNQQRQIFFQLQRAQSQEHQLQQDYAQLQYQQSALSKTSRIEQLANDSLKMQPIVTDRTQYLTLPPGAVKAVDTPLPSSSAAADHGSRR